MQLSKILKLNQFWDASPKTGFHFAILQELFLLQYEDKFSSIKKLLTSPLSLFYGHDDRLDVNSYVFRLRNGFKQRYNRTTLNLPIRKDQFHLRIDDDLFEKYSLNFDKQEEKTPASQNYQREYAINYLRNSSSFFHGVNHSDLDFSFNLIPFKKVCIFEMIDLI